MNPDDWSAFLKAKLDDRNPKCGNCRHWNKDMAHPTFGVCMAYPVGSLSQFERPTLANAPVGATTDLSLCSAWEKAPTKPDPE